MLDINLDPRNEDELLNQAVRYAFEKSGGTLTNLNASNPLIFLLEAQVFSGAELLWYVNQLPAKLLLYFLQQFRDLTEAPTKATGSITLYLTSPLTSNYTIETLEVSSGDEVYQLISPVVFLANQDSAVGLIEAVDFGSRFNKPAFSISTINTPRAYLRSVTNLSAIQGGTDPLTPEEAIKIYTQEFQDNQLISVLDYEREVKKLIGSDYQVKVIYKDGINVLIGNPETTDLDLIRAVQQNLEERSILTANLVVQELIQVPIQVHLTVRGNLDLADEFYAFLLTKFSNGLSYVRDYDLAGWCFEFGFTFVDGFLDVKNSRTKELNINEVLKLEYLVLNINGISVTYGNPIETKYRD